MHFRREAYTYRPRNELSFGRIREAVSHLRTTERFNQKQQAVRLTLASGRHVRRLLLEKIIL
jgi:hypothetical protein